MTRMTHPARYKQHKNWHEREKPWTVTRGLPYVIGPDYLRLCRLNREYSHMQRWHAYESRRLIEGQCERLHWRVYHEVCYYGGLPPEAYAYNSPFM